MADEHRMTTVTFVRGDKVENVTWNLNDGDYRETSAEEVVTEYFEGGKMVSLTLERGHRTLSFERLKESPMKEPSRGRVASSAEVDPTGDKAEVDPTGDKAEVDPIGDNAEVDPTGDKAEVDPTGIAK